MGTGTLEAPLTRPSDPEEHPVFTSPSPHGESGPLCVWCVRARIFAALPSRATRRALGSGPAPGGAAMFDCAVCRYRAVSNNDLHRHLRATNHSRWEYGVWGGSHANRLGGVCTSESAGGGCTSESAGARCASESAGCMCTSESAGGMCTSESAGCMCTSDSAGCVRTSESAGCMCTSESAGCMCTSESAG
eukprot:gene16553-biopygen5277